MIDKTKYLYWLDADDPQLGDEIIWRELYSRIGYLFHTIQMIEYNLANILAIEEFEKERNNMFTYDNVEILKDKISLKYDELSAMTFGKLKNLVKCSNYLKEINIEILNEIVEYRNYLAHNCFKEKLMNQELLSLEGVDKFIVKLNDYEEKIVNMNGFLVAIFAENKAKSILMYKNTKDF